MEDFGTDIPEIPLARKRIPLWKVHKAIMDLLGPEGFTPTVDELDLITSTFYSVVERNMRQDLEDTGELNRLLHQTLRELGD